MASLKSGCTSSRLIQVCVCSVASVFSDSDDGRKSAKLVFAKIDEASAREMIESVMKWMEEDA